MSIKPAGKRLRSMKVQSSAKSESSSFSKLTICWYALADAIYHQLLISTYVSFLVLFKDTLRKSPHHEIYTSSQTINSSSYLLWEWMVWEDSVSLLLLCRWDLIWKDFRLGCNNASVVYQRCFLWNTCNWQIRWETYYRSKLKLTKILT